MSCSDVWGTSVGCVPEISRELGKRGRCKRGLTSPCCFEGGERRRDKEKEKERGKRKERKKNENKKKNHKDKRKKKRKKKPQETSEKLQFLY